MTDFENLEIRDVDPGWLETRLSEKHMDLLWSCIEKRSQEPYPNLAGNLYGSYALENNKTFYNSIIDPLVRCWIKVYGDNIFGDQMKLIPWVSANMETYLNDWWVNYQHEGDYNPLHDHGGIFSFVIWMKIPTDWRDQKKLPRSTHSTSNTVSNFQFVYTNHLGKITTHTYYMSPEMEGGMLFFPANLKHTVYPFYDCKEERISISGNISVRSTSPS